MLTRYLFYEDIPDDIQAMILTVTGETDIKTIPLDDINGFLQGLEDFENSKDEEFDTGGWVFE